MVSVRHILRNSEELNRLTSRIDALACERPRSEAHLEACREFHARFDTLCFPGGDALFNRVRQHDPQALDAAIAFLLADPIHFRSGYLKEYLWRWLPHCPLTDTARTRLELAALGYLDRPVRREFAAMCKAMHRLGRDGFWMDISQALLSADALRVRRAELLLIHKGSLHAGAIARRALWERSLEEKSGNPQSPSYWLSAQKRRYSIGAGGHTRKPL